MPAVCRKSWAIPPFRTLSSRMRRVGGGGVAVVVICLCFGNLSLKSLGGGPDGSCDSDEQGAPLDSFEVLARELLH
jgi:hypothetical protein